MFQVVTSKSKNVPSQVIITQRSNSLVKLTGFQDEYCSVTDTVSLGDNRKEEYCISTELIMF
jgi:hypothetical protein